MRRAIATYIQASVQVTDALILKYEHLDTPTFNLLTMASSVQHPLANLPNGTVQIGKFVENVEMMAIR
jgi:hypothetical protein